MQIEEFFQKAPFVSPFDFADSPFTAWRALQTQSRSKEEIVRLIKESGVDEKEWFDRATGELFYKGFAYFLYREIFQENGSDTEVGQLNYLQTDLFLTKWELFRKGASISTLNALINSSSAIAMAYHQCYNMHIYEERHVVDLMKMIHEMPERSLAFPSPHL